MHASILTDILYHQSLWICVAIMASTYILIKNLLTRKNRRRIKLLQETGAIRFLADASNYHRTLVTFNQTPGDEATKARAASVTQRALHKKSREITGIVCGEDLLAIVENGEMFVSVYRKETATMLREASIFLYDQNSRVYFGIEPLKMYITVDGDEDFEKGDY